jgi:hypothetical protein
MPLAVPDPGSGTAKGRVGRLRLIGRTMGAYRLLAWGTMPLGAMLFGAMAAAWGTPRAFGVGAGLMLLLGLSLAPVVCGDARLASPEGDDG